MTMTYAGVGSRAAKDDPEAMALMSAISTKLESLGWHLNTGDASGADAAFTRGVKNPSNVTAFTAGDATGDPKAMAMFEKYHPNPNAPCFQSSRSRELMARNSYQILGRELDSPVKFLICWAPNSKTDADGTIMDVRGGTGQAVRIAYAHQIPVFNIHNRHGLMDHYERVTSWLAHC